MSQVAPPRPVPETRASVPAGHYGALGALRSEWTKMRSVRSTSWSLIATVVIILGIGAIATAVVAARWTQLDPLDRISFDPTNQSLAGILFGQLAIGILGILVVSAEYGTGTIRATLAAIPNRWLVLVAKTVVFGAVALVVGEATSFAAFFLGQALLHAPAPHAVLSQPGVLRAVVGSGLYLAVLGLFALGLAVIIRHTAGSIATFVGLLLVLPLIVQALPSSISHPIGKYLPTVIGFSMTSTVTSRVRGPDLPLFSPWVGFGLLCAYAAAALVIGGILLARRDA